MQEPQLNSSSQGKRRSPAEREQRSLRELLLSLASLKAAGCTVCNAAKSLGGERVLRVQRQKHNIGERPPPRRMRF